jgi:hypothetical protein
MNKYDLIPKIEELEFLFVLESPYANEVASDIPCVGSTGLRMSQGIFNTNEIAFGHYLKTGQKGFEKYGIMNSFSFPLELHSAQTEEQKQFSKLKDVQWIAGVSNRSSHYNGFLTILNSIENVEGISNFKIRFTNYVNQAPNLKYIVFCGYIAQSMYLFSFKQAIQPYNKPILMKTKSQRELYLMFVNHPSERNGQWDFKLSSITK